MAVIIDGEALTFRCRECGHVFKHIIGYGPAAPSPWLRPELLKKNPPVCPHCSSSDVRHLSPAERLFK